MQLQSGWTHLLLLFKCFHWFVSFKYTVIEEKIFIQYIYCKIVVDHFNSDHMLKCLQLLGYLICVKQSRYILLSLKLLISISKNKFLNKRLCLSMFRRLHIRLIEQFRIGITLFYFLNINFEGFLSGLLVQDFYQFCTQWVDSGACGRARANPSQNIFDPSPLLKLLARKIDKMNVFF